MSEIPGRIGTYPIECELGRGGMGVVYKGTDSRLGRSVAIKALPPHLADDPDLLHRFEQEARTLASLSHSNVGAIYGLEEHENRKYLVLEYIDGETLAERLARGPLRLGEALDVCAQIAEGLAAAHDAGFVHRDLKPANVKLATSGLAKILDFGLARIAGGGDQQPATADAPTVGPSASMTTPGTIVGTPQYMSPEQARAGKVDRRADVWALGVVLYECLTGTSPFERASPAESIAAILTDEPDMTALPASTPAEVVALIGRCLRKDARRRQRDAGDCRLVLDDARDAIAGEDPTARRATRISDKRFCISDELCRSLDRTGFDALLPGWEMRYADNNRESDVLIVWIPSIGGDHTTSAWRELIAAAPYRMVVVCPVGMEPGVANRPVVSMENQLALIRALARHLRATLGPKKLVVTGFSCGSIMALRCAASDQSGGLFDGVLAIDPDMQESDCFVTRLFAGLDASSTRDVMNSLHTISDSCCTIDEWLVLHQHMLECVDKVKTDLSPLVRQGKDLSAPFEGVHTGDRSPFVHYLRDAIERTGVVRCVFHDSAENRRMLGEVRMAHLDTHCLGDSFSDETLKFIPVTDHVGMMSTDRLLEQLDLIVAAV